MLSDLCTMMMSLNQKADQYEAQKALVKNVRLAHNPKRHYITCHQNISKRQNTTYN